jgi:hypothetical protein
MSTPRKTILLTGGRAPVTLDLARMFHDAGHRVVVAESLPQHLCRHSRFVARSFDVPAPNGDFDGFIGALARVVRHERVDLLVPTCEEIFHVSRGRDTLSAHCEVLAAPWNQLRRLHSKWDFIQALAARGVTVPETWLLESQADADALLSSLPAGTKLVFKPVFSRFATQVAFPVAGQPAPALNATPERPWVAQRFVSGRGVCTWSVARDGRLTAHAAYANNFTAGTGASINFEPLEHPGLLGWVRDFAEAERFTGQLAFDFIESDDGTLYPLECNPRATSGIHLFTEADRLDEAFFGTGVGIKLPRADAASMLGLAMLVYGLRDVDSPARLGEWAQTVVKSRDAVFRWDDPAPFFQQFAVFGHLLAVGQARGISALEASTHDIEWNG